jgi:putative ABC transport system permease protein
MLVIIYIRLAMRNFLRQKLFTTINVLSLSIGLAFSAIAVGLVTISNSFDEFHPGYESIYRLQGGIKTFSISNTPPPLGPALAESYPQVKDVVRIADREVIIRLDGSPISEKALLADRNFFSFFNFSLRSGTAVHAFAEEKNVVVTPSFANKYFGHEQVIGSVLQISIEGREELFTISGIANEAPLNSSIRFDLIIPLSNGFLENPEDIATNWQAYSLSTFVSIEGKALAAVEQSMPSFVATHMGESIRSDGSDPAEYKFTFHALSNYHADGTHASGMIPPRDPRIVKVFGLISAFILLIAFFNFCNLTAAQNVGRITETGIRRMMGARMKNLMAQFLIEGTVVSLVSLGVAILFILIFSRTIEQFLGMPVPVGALSIPAWTAIVTITIFTGLLIGVVSVMLPGRASVVAALRKTYKTTERSWLTRSGLAIQFSIAIVILGCALVISRQQRFVSVYDKGYSDKNVMVIHTGGAIDHQAYLLLRNELLSLPGVEKVSAVSHSFSRGNSAFIIRRENQPMTAVYDYRADEDYVELLGIGMTSGRMPVAGSNEIVVNQSFLNTFNIEQPLGLILDDTYGSLTGRQISGVVRDYHFQSLMEKMQPMTLRPLGEKDEFRSVLVRYETSSVSGLVHDAGTTWRNTASTEPFDFSFLHDDVMKDYQAEERWNRITQWSAFLAVGIALLGVFGLTSLQLAKRVREIGIRKVLGATDLSIMTLIQKQYVWIIIVAQLVSLPLTWWIAGEWMSNFVYKTDVPWVVFAAGGFVTLTVTMLLSGIQVVHVAGRNSADVLHGE